MEYKSPQVVTGLYNSYVRPDLEYCIRTWRPYLKKDIQILEAVQRRATKMILGMEGLHYEDRLKALDMYSLERRYLRGDMIQVFKMFLGLDDLNIEKYFVLDSESVTRAWEEN